MARREALRLIRRWERPVEGRLEDGHTDPLEDQLEAREVVRRVNDLRPGQRTALTCKLLGLSRSAGYRAVAAGQIPTVKLGRRLYVPMPRLLALLGAVETTNRAKAPRKGL